METPREIPRPVPVARPDLREDFQSEIKARVANFRAHQERFNREREAYCTATMAKVHAALKEGELRRRGSINSLPPAGRKRHSAASRHSTLHGVVFEFCPDML